MSMTPEQLSELLADGEGPHVEFKHRASDPRFLADALAALANTRGGALLVGVDDRLWGAGDPYEAVVGVEDVAEARDVLGRALRQVDPELSIDVSEVSVDGKVVLVAEVGEQGLGAGPFVGPFGIRVRTEHGATRPMPKEQLLDALSFGLQGADDSSRLARLLRLQEEMNLKLDEQGRRAEDAERQLVAVNAKLDASERRAERAEGDLAKLKSGQGSAAVAAQTRHHTTMRAVEGTRAELSAGGRLRAQWRPLLVGAVLGAVLGTGLSELVRAFSG
jgi:predicted HTH transcriptional regulator